MDVVEFEESARRKIGKRPEVTLVDAPPAGGLRPQDRRRPVENDDVHFPPERAIEVHGEIELPGEADPAGAKPTPMSTSLSDRSRPASNGAEQDGELDAGRFERLAGGLWKNVEHDVNSSMVDGSVRGARSRDRRTADRRPWQPDLGQSSSVSVANCANTGK